MGLIAYLIVDIICGFITKSINESKGYDGGFGWGFFLNIIGILIVAVRPYYQDPTNKSELSTYSSLGTSSGPSTNSYSAPKPRVTSSPKYTSYGENLKICENAQRFVLFQYSNEVSYDFQEYNGYEILVNDAPVDSIPEKTYEKQFEGDTYSFKILVHLKNHPDETIPVVTATYKGTNSYNMGIMNMERYVAGLSTMSSFVKIEESKDSKAADEPTKVYVAKSPAEEIREYKSLLDDGIITQEEFDAKKKQLLNIPM